MAGRDKDATTWRSLGALCRERDWSRPRALYELQNGLRFRTVPPGQEHRIDWERISEGLINNLNLATSELSLFFLDPPTVGIEVMPPSDIDPTVSASVEWAIATTRNLRAGDKIPEGMTKAELARLLEAEAQKAVRAGQLSRALKASYLENQLAPWGIWPLNSPK
jgi:hypothetical protein